MAKLGEDGARELVGRFANTNVTVLELVATPSAGSVHPRLRRARGAFVVRLFKT